MAMNYYFLFQLLNRPDGFAGLGGLTDALLADAVPSAANEPELEEPDKRAFNAFISSPLFTCSIAMHLSYEKPISASLNAFSCKSGLPTVEALLAATNG